MVREQTRVVREQTSGKIGTCRQQGEEKVGRDDIASSPAPPREEQQGKCYCSRYEEMGERKL